MHKQIIQEVYCALVLLGAESDLLGTVGSWGDGLSEESVLDSLRAWNQGAFLEIRGRIEHYEISYRHPAYILDDFLKTSVEGR